MKSNIKINIFIFLFSLIFSFVTVELVFRLFVTTNKTQTWSDRPRTYFYPDKISNSRDYIYSPTKAKNVFRVITVGDSFTFAGKVQFDEAYPKRLERILNLSSKNYKTEVIKVARPGLSTEQEERLLRKTLEKYETDLVVLQITLNDPAIKPYHSSHIKEIKKKEKILFYINSKPISLSKSLQFILQRLYNSYTHYLTKKYYNDIFNDQKNWGSFIKALNKIKDLSRNKNFKVIAVTFPLLTDNLDGTYPYKHLHKKINSELRLLGIDNLDLLKVYKNIPHYRLEAEPSIDSHPNEIAHILAADAIYYFLERKHYIPKNLYVKNKYKRIRRA